MELFLKYPIDVQQELLTRLLDVARNTVVGKQYDYKTIYDYKTFAARVPIKNMKRLNRL